MALSTNFDLADELLKHQTINVDQITENKCNRIILTRLMHDDPSLTSLTLSNYNDDDDASTFNVTSGLSALLGLLKTSSKMKQLHLDLCVLNDDNIPALASILKEAKLEYLSLVGNMGITSQGWGLLSEALVGHATLETLDLRLNSIDEAVAIKFAGALKENATLKTLYLVGNEAITEVGWSAFADLYFAARQALRRPYIPTTLSRVWAL